MANNIHPIKVNQPEDIGALLEQLRTVLNGTPPPWLRKAMLKGRERSFDFESAAAPSLARGPADVQEARMPRRPGMAESGLDPIGGNEEREHG